MMPLFQAHMICILHNRDIPLFQASLICILHNINSMKRANDTYKINKERRKPPYRHAFYAQALFVKI